MGTATAGGRITDSSDVKPNKLVTALKINRNSTTPIEDNIDETFYPTCEPFVCHIKQDLDTDEFQQEVEISDYEEESLDIFDSEDTKEGIISSIVTCDHSYNKPSPIFETIISDEPMSPISSTLSSRSTPDVATVASDYGYESQNSPSSSIDDISLINLDEFPFWDDPISELFPSLA